MSNLESEGSEFEDELEGKHRGEDHIETVEQLGIGLGLLVKLHGQGDRVYHDQYEYRVLKRLRGHEPPDLVLDPVLGNVSSNGFRFQREFDAVSLKKGIVVSILKV